jgi:hypothetical protein
MIAAIFSLVAAGASIASLLVVRQVKRDHDAAMEALKPFAAGLAKANQLLMGDPIAKKSN